MFKKRVYTAEVENILMSEEDIARNKVFYRFIKLREKLILGILDFICFKEKREDRYLVLNINKILFDMQELKINNNKLLFVDYYNWIWIELYGKEHAKTILKLLGKLDNGSKMPIEWLNKEEELWEYLDGIMRKLSVDLADNKFDTIINYL